MVHWKLESSIKLLKTAKDDLRTEDMNGSCVSYLNLQWDRIKMSEARLDSGSVLYELLLHVFEEKTWCCTWLLRLQSPTQALEIQGVQIANQNWIELG